MKHSLIHSSLSFLKYKQHTHVIKRCFTCDDQHDDLSIDANSQATVNPQVITAMDAAPSILYPSEQGGRGSGGVNENDEPSDLVCSAEASPMRDSESGGVMRERERYCELTRIGLLL
jgi:hypothetical protein